MSKVYNILIVEDDDENIFLIKKALASENINLYSYNDPHEALSFLKTCDENSLPDVILLDINMPEMNGFEFIDYYKCSNFYRPVPIIVLTVSKEDEDVLKSYHKGASGYVSKPISFEELYRVMKNIKSYCFDTIRLPPRKRVKK